MPSKKIPDRDISQLWGRAAGRCSRCKTELAPLLDSGTVALLGEMCHVIARSQGGPRGSEAIPENRRNRYENLILLCPTHHTLIDDSPEDFSVSQILEWKIAHEAEVSTRLESESFATKADLMRHVLGLLNENRVVWETFGPESAAARNNPLTRTVEFWEVRKLTTVIPNNAMIIARVEAHRKLLSPGELGIFARFREHALAFERSTHSRLDRAAQPRFPQEFRQFAEEASRGSD